MHTDFLNPVVVGSTPTGDTILFLLTFSEASGIFIRKYDEVDKITVCSQAKRPEGACDTFSSP